MERPFLGKERLNSRILYIITDSGIGGSERVLLSLLQSFKSEQIKPVGVVVLKNKRESAALWEETGVPVISLGMKRMPSPFLLWTLHRIIQSFSPDLVHSFLFHSVQAARLVKWAGAKFKLISSPRVNYRFASFFAHRLDALLKRMDDFAICESQATRRFLVEALHYEAAGVEVVLNGVDVEKFQLNIDARQRIRQEWGVSSDQVIIGAVGRLHQQKGFDILLEAMSMIQNLPVPHKLVIVGEGPLEKHLQQAAKNYSLDVLFTGLHRQMEQVYSAFDLYVQSSRYEGMSNALLEAMSTGLACVATAVDGTLDVAQDGENMILVKPEDPVSLSVGLGVAIEKKDLRRKLGKNARATAEQMSVGSMVRGYQSIYQKVLGSPSEVN